MLKLLPPKAFAADLIIIEHAVKNLESYLILLMARISGKKVAIWGHGHTVTTTVSAFTRSLQRSMARLSDWYFAYTTNSAERAVRIGADPGRITVLNNSKSTASLETIVTGVNENRTSYTCLYVGALDESKKIPFLLRSCEEVFSREHNFRLKVIGDGPDARQLDGPISRGWCEYLGSGPIEDFAENLYDVVLILMPGRVGLVAVDSLALGLPIVTTESKAHAPEFEYLDESNSVVTENDESSFANGVVGLLHDRPRLQQLSGGCRSRAPSYTIEAMAERFAFGIAEIIGVSQLASTAAVDVRDSESTYGAKREGGPTHAGNCST
ncbi:glycosyltransferase [Gordonia sp. LSe1-13]|uniref:Glycosyltransferase n=1 Tax=Gordonia sesuvii TaxID=3116777 RepID=A0ABU7ME25_9ACTN|nr:glycosyltransferase [Gordonia sp. LSe1-13]